MIARLIGIMVYAAPVHAMLVVHNETNFPLYMAGYVTDTEANRKTEIRKIEKHSSTTIDVPAMALLAGKRRYIAVSHEQDNLAIQLSLNKLREFPRINVSSRLSIFGGIYYVEDREGRLAIYNNVEYSSIGSFIKGIAQNIKKKFTKRIVVDEESLSAIRNNPHRSQVARIRKGPALAHNELSYLAQRKFKVEETLHKLLPETTEHHLFSKRTTRVPIISVILSGGGNRAMFSSCGFMQGLQEIGILDATTYVAALSGSTWFLGSWFASKEPLIANFRKKLVQTMVRGLRLDSSHEYSLMLDEFKIKYLYHQPMTTIDLLGALLGNALFREYGDKRYQIYLSDHKNRVETADWPFPIYTAIEGSGIRHKDEAWYEFTPYEVGATWLNSYIPTWAFGRRFAQGKSVDDAPEISLAFLFGIFGSAPSIDIYRAWQEMEKKITINEHVKKFMHTHILNPIGHKRLTRGEEFNFTVGMPESPLQHRKYMTPIDGGFGHNLPYPVVSGEHGRRASDILIFFDASEKVKKLKSDVGEAADALHKAEKYAREHHLNFPHITEVLPRMINIYKDENDPSVPVVMWIPCTYDAKKYQTVALHDKAKRFTNIKGFDFSKCINDFCMTPNFVYTPAQAEKLITLGQFCAHACADEIIEEIAWKMEQMAR